MVLQVMVYWEMRKTEKLIDLKYINIISITAAKKRTTASKEEREKKTPLHISLVKAPLND